MRAFVRRFVSSPPAVFVAIAVLQALSTRGRPLASPWDTATYVKLADSLRHPNASAVFTGEYVRWSKLLFLSLLASVRTLTPAHWMGVMVAFNVVFSAIAGTLVVDLVRRATRSSGAAAAAFVLYALAWEIFSWVAYVLTDQLYLMTSMFVVYTVGRGVIGEPLRRQRLMVMLSLVAAMLSRPPAVVFIPLTIFTGVVLVDSPNQRLRRVMVWLLIVGSVVATIAQAAIMADASRWPLRWLRPRIEEIATREKTGEIVYDRPEYNHRTPSTAVDYLVMDADRFVRFFQVTAVRNSRVHNAINLLWFGPLYLLCAIGIVDVFRQTDVRQRNAVIMSLLWIGASALFIALTMLDFDWRYRMPLLPNFIIIAAFGVAAIERRVSVASGTRDGVAQAITNAL